MNSIQLSSLNYVINDIVDILQCDSKMDINYHSKTIDHIYDCTYKTIYQYVNLFLDTKEKIYIIDKFYVKTDIIESKNYITLDQKCAYTISQYIYFDIYLELKKITNNELSLCF